MAERIQEIRRRWAEVPGGLAAPDDIMFLLELVDKQQGFVEDIREYADLLHEQAGAIGQHVDNGMRAEATTRLSVASGLRNLLAILEESDD